jgi:hypothetical protein
MKTLEELKNTWTSNLNMVSPLQPYDQKSLEKMFKSRVKKSINNAMQYFWASFTLQIIVYALLSHILVKYWSDSEVLVNGIGGFLLFVPFTIMLMLKFKRIAKTTLAGDSGVSLHEYVLTHYGLLESFYRFKRAYEFLLIPVSSAIGVFLTFKLYMPGGVFEHPIGAAIVFLVTILSCAFAIRAENKKSFQKPLRDLQTLLNEFNEEKVQH